MTIWHKLTNSAECSSYPISIFMAGDVNIAKEVCQKFCNDVGFCVTITATTYVYSKGSEKGFIIGIINYPRFPLEPEQLFARASDLADLLLEACNQQSLTVQGPGMSYWESYRPKEMKPC